MDPETDLQVSKVDSPDPVIAGNQLTYTITVTNLGPSDATGVVVTETLPGAVSYVSDTPSQGTYNSGTAEWSVGPLADGASETLTLTVLVDPATTGTITNRVCVTGNETDPTLANNCDDEKPNWVPRRIPRCWSARCCSPPWHR